MTSREATGSAAWVSRMEPRRHLYACVTGGSSAQRSGSAVAADPPPGIADQPIILPFSTGSPTSRAPWRTGTTSFTRRSSPSRRSDTTVRLWERQRFPPRPPSVSLRGGLGDAGKAGICWTREDKMAEIFSTGVSLKKNKPLCP